MGIKWPDSFLTGIPYIDELHKEIFNGINEILEIISIPEKREVAEKKFAFFENYIYMRFKEEELIQKNYGYCNCYKQRMQHEEFKRLFKLLKEKFEGKEISREFVKDIESKMNRWWQEHINNSNMDLEKFLKERKKIIRY